MKIRPVGLASREAGRDAGSLEGSWIGMAGQLTLERHPRPLRVYIKHAGLARRAPSGLANEGL
ncbi:MAG: hypothetical protein H0T77_05275 [Pyrinomonadaceae bacterium]|nr:hypothetical protein [Pyrinomonadaceae bacterium]